MKTQTEIKSEIVSKEHREPYYTEPIERDRLTGQIFLQFSLAGVTVSKNQQISYNELMNRIKDMVEVGVE